ncbi:Na+/H+ antiporter [Photobacterium marinum]|uniref:Na+/H+ antiporter n=1 Tax=Photobacterium marinum TaxID=1056511 RepID=L8JHJ5_9GAMM|nr:Na+/H+ antiporter NhaC family protein [Photobacterium marinum]ELR66922.1 Na+/H+ antiporter [Photobacterium marinum]
MNTWVCLLPPIIAITLAITTRQALLSIYSGVLIGAILLQRDLLAGITMSFDAVAQTFSSESTVKSLIFILVIGAIINVLRQSGAVSQAILMLTEQKKWVKTQQGAQILTFLMGFLMCLEGIGSMMMVGLVGRPLFAQHHLSKEKLAYVANSTGAPLAWLLPVSGAGVFLASLLNAQVEQGVLSGQSMVYLFDAIHYQFYTILVLLSVPVLAIFRHDFSSNINRERTQKERESTDAEKATISVVTVMMLMMPIAILLGSIFLIMTTTGNGNPLKGTISDAIYWSGFITLIGSGFIYRLAGVVFGKYMAWVMEGFKQILPAVVILVLAFTLSYIIGLLGTGHYLAGMLATNFPFWFMPAVIFLAGIVISFSTGSSAATVSILTPIVIPMAMSLGLEVALVIGALVSGAVFGDQSSPISDSVIVAASAADCEPERHFRTQLPLTLSFAVLSFTGYIIVGSMG